MAVRMLSGPSKTAVRSGASSAVREAVRSKSAEYVLRSEKGRQASELAKEIRNFEERFNSNPKAVVRSRDAKSGLFNFSQGLELKRIARRRAAT